MKKAPVNQMIDFALEALMSGDDQRRRAMIREMCTKWQEVPALSVVLAVTSAGSMVEDTKGGSSDVDRVAPLAYKYSALLAADVYAIETMGQVPPVARDLLHFWRRVDSYFLTV